VDALLIVNNEQISKVFSDSHIPVDEALRRADAVMANAVRSISELITLNGKIQTDFSDVKTTMKNGGGAIMSIGRASGEHRVQNAVLNALQSPLLYGSDISKATRILFNIYTSSEHELFVDELEEIDAFMDELDPSIDVIWGMAIDDTLDEDAKITILATGFENALPIRKYDDDVSMDKIISEIYGKRKKRTSLTPATPNSNPSPVKGEEEEVTNEIPKKVPEALAVQEKPDNSESPETQGSPVVESASSLRGRAGGDTKDSPENPIDPSRAFFNRVKNRFLQGLSSLTKEED
jgi:cell division protein FtsZ